MDYKNAGVDIEAGYRSVELMKKHVQETMRKEVLKCGKANRIHILEDGDIIEL